MTIVSVVMCKYQGSSSNGQPQTSCNDKNSKIDEVHKGRLTCFKVLHFDIDHREPWPIYAFYQLDWSTLNLRVVGL